MATRTKSSIDPAIFKKASVGGYLPSEQYTELKFRAEDAPEDAPLIVVRVRTDLTNAELANLEQIPEEGATIRHNWIQIAPLVIGWNVQHRAEDGVVYDVAPPAEAGPDVFRFIPNQLFWQINSGIALRPYRRIDPKASDGSAHGDATTPANA